jgi:hypothetical protein
MKTCLLIWIAIFVYRAAVELETIAAQNAQIIELLQHR